MSIFEKHGFNFTLTCASCPEQYDVTDCNGKQVAYVRLRWGGLSVVVPDVGGELIHDKSYDEAYLGEFPNEEERESQLNIIADKLKNLKG